MRFYKLLSIAILGGMIVFMGCSEESQTSTVNGTVYWAEAHIIPNPQDTALEDTIFYLNPVQGGRVYLLQDESSDNPCMIEDLYTTTDDSGRYSFTFYLGRDFDANSLMFDELKMCDVEVKAIWTPNGKYVLHSGDTAQIAYQFENQITGVTVKTGTTFKAPDLIIGYVYFK